MINRATLALLLAVSAAVAGCAAGAPRLPPPERVPGRAGVLTVRWRTVLHSHGLFEGRREECARGAVIGSRLVIGSRNGRIVSVDRTAGTTAWTFAAGGGVDAEAVYDAKLGQVYLGSDDGSFYALDPDAGTPRWTTKLRGNPETMPALGPQSVFVTTTDRLYSLDPKTGKTIWQYERDTPEGFTIHGQAGPRFAAGSVYTGFSDGYLVSLDGRSGEVHWIRPLFGTAEQFLDVDTTPAVLDDLVVAASYAGGVYGLGARDGNTLWRLPVEGAQTPLLEGGLLYFATAREGLHAVRAQTGEIIWRQGLPDAGDVTAPQSVGPYLTVSGSRGGLYLLDRESGRLLETFDPGDGVCAPATPSPDGHQLYVLANSGALYALNVAF